MSSSLIIRAVRDRSSVPPVPFVWSTRLSACSIERAQGEGVASSLLGDNVQHRRRAEERTSVVRSLFPLCIEVIPLIFREEPGLYERREVVVEERSYPLPDR